MANPGIFNLLITDDTEQDSFLIAQTQLSNRIKEIKVQKINIINNSILDLTNAYNKANNDILSIVDLYERQLKQNEINELLKNINFLNNNKLDLIKPTINEINETHFLFLNNQYKPFVEFGFNYIISNVNSKPAYGNELEFNVQSNGDFISDMMIFIRLSELNAADDNDRVRYADFIGHKIIKKCQFIISNNVLDEYDRELYNIHYNFHVPEGKKISWLKCMGQEIPITGTLISDPINDEFKEIKTICNGYQTLKKQQPKLDLFIPLLFWFNKDIRLAFPNHIQPSGQVKIRIELEKADALMNSIDVVNDVYNQRYSIPDIEICSLYTKHIYINTDIQDIFISKLGINLIRIYKKIEKQLLVNNDSLLLQELKYPIEELYLFFRPDSNETGIDNFQTWHLNSILNLSYIKTPIIYKINGIDTLGINSIKYYNELPIIDTLKFEYNDSSIYGTQLKGFYDSYMPYITSNNIMSNNNNIYYLPFSFMPESNQPCGYINLSKTREINLEYTSSTIESNKPIKLYIYAKALNFVLITKNAATLKYLT